MQKSQIIFRSIWPIGLMVLIFVESSIPMDGGSDNIVFLTHLDPSFQNLLHIPLYGTLSFLWLNFFVSIGYPLRKAILLAIFITIGYGCLDEFHQSFVRGRYAGLLDILLNGVGAIVGIWISLWRFAKAR
ncbi:MAG: VanZ family protein [Desulfobacula sp.]|jgi:VanZ family protein